VFVALAAIPSNLFLSAVVKFWSVALVAVAPAAIPSNLFFNVVVKFWSVALVAVAPAATPFNLVWSALVNTFESLAASTAALTCALLNWVFVLSEAGIVTVFVLTAVIWPSLLVVIESIAVNV